MVKFSAVKLLNGMWPFKRLTGKPPAELKVSEARGVAVMVEDEIVQYLATASLSELKEIKIACGMQAFDIAIQLEKHRAK